MNVLKLFTKLAVVWLTVFASSQAQISTPAPTYFVDSDSTAPDLNCGSLTSACSSVAAAFEQAVLDGCLSDPDNGNLLNVLLRIGKTFRETDDLTMPCDHMVLSNYNPVTRKKRVACLDDNNCPVITRAEQVPISSWTPPGVGETYYSYTANTPGLARATLIDPLKLFKPGKDKIDPTDTARLPEVRRSYSYGFGDDEIWASQAGFGDCTNSHLVTDFPDCGQQSLDPGQWGQKNIGIDTRQIFFHDDNGRLSGSDPLEISTAQYVLRTADPINGPTRVNLTIEHVFMYGVGLNIANESNYPAGVPTYGKRVSAVLNVTNSSEVSVKGLRVEAGGLHALSVMDNAKEVHVTDSDISDSSTWCVDAKYKTEDVTFERIAAHHCGNNLGDTVDGHGIGIRNTTGVTVLNSAVYANGYAGGKATDTFGSVIELTPNYFVRTNPTQRNAKSAFVLYHVGDATIEYNKVACNWRGGIATNGNVHDFDGDGLPEVTAQSLSNNSIAGNGRIAFTQIGAPSNERESRYIRAMYVTSDCELKGLTMNNNNFNWNVGQQHVDGRQGVMNFQSLPLNMAANGGCHITDPSQSPVFEIDELKNNHFCYSMDVDASPAYPPSGNPSTEYRSFMCQETGNAGLVTVLSDSSNEADNSIFSLCNGYDPTLTWATYSSFACPLWPVVGVMLVEM